jgi:hypothetical protein
MGDRSDMILLVSEDANDDMTTLDFAAFAIKGRT